MFKPFVIVSLFLNRMPVLTFIIESKFPYTLTFTTTYSVNCDKQALPVCFLCITLALDQSRAACITSALNFAVYCFLLFWPIGFVGSNSLTTLFTKNQGPLQHPFHCNFLLVFSANQKTMFQLIFCVITFNMYTFDMHRESLCVFVTVAAH